MNSTEYTRHFYIIYMHTTEYLRKNDVEDIRSFWWSKHRDVWRVSSAILENGVKSTNKTVFEIIVTETSILKWKIEENIISLSALCMI